MADNWAEPFDHQAVERQERLARVQAVMTAAEEEASAWPELRQHANQVVIPGLRAWIAKLKPHTQPLQSRRHLHSEVVKLKRMRTAPWTNRKALAVRMGNTGLRFRIAWAWVVAYRWYIAAVLAILLVLLIASLVVYLTLFR